MMHTAIDASQIVHMYQLLCDVCLNCIQILTKVCLVFISISLIRSPLRIDAGYPYNCSVNKGYLVLSTY